MVGVWFLAMLFALVGGALWLYALVDVLRRPKTNWTAAGHDQVVWVVVVVMLSFVGALLYLMVAKPALDAAMATERAAASV